MLYSLNTNMTPCISDASDSWLTNRLGLNRWKNVIVWNGCTVEAFDGLFLRQSRLLQMFPLQTSVSVDKTCISQTNSIAIWMVGANKYCILEFLACFFLSGYNCNALCLCGNIYFAMRVQLQLLKCFHRIASWHLSHPSIRLSQSLSVLEVGSWEPQK